MAMGSSQRHQATFKIGHVDLRDGSRISRELVDDIESLLISVIQPPGNMQGTANYYGRDLVYLAATKSLD